MLISWNFTVTSDLITAETSMKSLVRHGRKSSTVQIDTLELLIDIKDFF